MIAWVFLKQRSSKHQLFLTEATYDNDIFSGLCQCAVKVLGLTITSLVFCGAVALAVTAFILQYFVGWTIIKYSQVWVVKEQCSLILDVILPSGRSVAWTWFISIIAVWKSSQLLLNCIPDTFTSKADLITAYFGGSGTAAYLCLITNQVFSSSSRN